ncbi:MAG: hypothetical protein LBV22_00760 [Mycoplasmataceae bacterium]|nr:hypothetical protein [Mycoplasmataceae bacterium]
MLLYKANKPFYKSLATQHKPIARALVEKINDDYLKKNNGECPDCQTKMIRRGKNRAGFCCFYCPKCKKFRTGSEGTYFWNKRIDLWQYLAIVKLLIEGNSIRQISYKLRMTVPWVFHIRNLVLPIMNTLDKAKLSTDAYYNAIYFKILEKGI